MVFCGALLLRRCAADVLSNLEQRQPSKYSRNSFQIRFLDFINLYDNPDDQTSLSGQIAALEVDMVTLSHATHNPETCAHCAAQKTYPDDIGSQLQPLEAIVSNSSSAALPIS